MIITKTLIIIISMWVILSAIWYYKPTSFLNIKYRTVSKNKIEDFEGPMLIVASHVYCQADNIILCSESNKSKNKFNIIAARKWLKEPLSQFFREFPLYTSYERIDVYENQKNNTVSKSIDKLNKKENVVFLCSKHTSSKGIYYVLEKTKVPILFLRIYKKDKKNIKDYETANEERNLLNFVNADFDLEYEKVDTYPIDKTPEEFMVWIKEKLYEFK